MINERLVFLPTIVMLPFSLAKWRSLAILSLEIYSFIYTGNDKMKTLATLLHTQKTVFTISELKQIFKKENGGYINLLLQPLKRQWILINPHYGIWAFKEYDILELASKLKSHSYISYETVLQRAGIIFQNYEHTITLASNNTLTKKIKWYDFVYHKIRDSILTNPIGIINHNNTYMIASPERAICDTVYLYNTIVFDNLRPLQTEKIQEIAYIYPKKTFLLLMELIKNVESSTT